MELDVTLHMVGWSPRLGRIPLCGFIGARFLRYARATPRRLRCVPCRAYAKRVGYNAPAGVFVAIN